MNKSTLALLAAAFIPPYCNAQSEQQTAQTRPDSSITAPRMLSRPDATGTNSPTFKAGDRLVAYEMAWQTPDTETVVDRLAGALAVIQNSDERSNKVDKSALLEIAGAKNTGEWVHVPDTSLLAQYSAQHNEIRIINQELDAITDSSRRIKDDEALKLAEGFLKQLGENRVIDSRLYRQAVAQIGYKMAGEGSVDAKSSEARIVEYRITYRPTLNDIELANAGVRLGILGSGELASMRVGGITPIGKWDANTLKSSVEDSQRTVRNPPDALMKAFYNTHKGDAKPEIAWSRVMYALGEDQKSGTVEPMLVISYSVVRTIDDQPVVSRRKMLGYSLTSNNVAPIDFDSPAARHADTKATRTDSVKDQ